MESMSFPPLAKLISPFLSNKFAGKFNTVPQKNGFSRSARNFLLRKKICTSPCAKIPHRKFLNSGILSVTESETIIRQPEKSTYHKLTTCLSLKVYRFEKNVFTNVAVCEKRQMRVLESDPYRFIFIFLDEI